MIVKLIENDSEVGNETYYEVIANENDCEEEYKDRNKKKR